MNGIISFGRMLRRTTVLLIALFLVPFATILVYWQTNAWVIHTLDVEVTLGELRAVLVDAESSQRGFLLNGRPDHQAGYIGNITRLPGLIDRVETLTADNPVQRAATGDLRRAVETKVEHMTESIAAKMNGNPLPFGGQGRSSMNAVLAIVQSMKAEETRLLEARTWRGNLLFWATLAASVLFLAQAAWLVRTSALTVRRELEKQRREAETLAQTVADRDLLLGEVNHRVKNSLQMVSALIALQGARAAPEARRSFTEMATRIQAIAAIHQRLYQSNRFRTMALAPYLRDLCADIVQTLPEDRSCIAEVPEIDPVDLPVEHAVPLGTIVNELVTNAVKHGGRRIIVRLERRPDSLSIMVCDDGPGLPPGFDPARSTGLGWKLIQGFARQAGATITHVPGDRSGTCVELVLPALPDPAGTAAPPRMGAADSSARDERVGA